MTGREGRKCKLRAHTCSYDDPSDGIQYATVTSCRLVDGGPHLGIWEWDGKEGVVISRACDHC